MSKTTAPRLLALVLCMAGGAAHADLYQAIAAADKQDYVRAFELYRELAELGHPEAQENLAVMYVNGEGVQRDNVLGYAWAKLALDNGGGEPAREIVRQLEPHLTAPARQRIAELQAQFSNQALRASLFPTSNNAPQNPNRLPCRMKTLANPDSYYPEDARRQGIFGEALIEARVAADGSVRLPRARYSFPPQIFEEAGRAVALNSHYTPAMENGVFVPCTIVFKIAFKMKFVSNSSSTVKPSAAALRAVEELRTKALAGDPNSQLNYALVRSLRPEYRPDKNERIDWFLKAAQAGVPAAQCQLGMRLMNADTMPVRDPVKGVRWLEMGAKGGSGCAMSALASYLLAPGQTAESRNQGFEWLRRASGTIHREGKFLFAALLVSWPDAAKRDPGRALALLDEVGVAFDYDPLLSEIRAAAYAGQGDFKKAQRAQSKAVDMAAKLGWDTASQRARLQAYAQGLLPESELVTF